MTGARSKWPAPPPRPPAPPTPPPELGPDAGGGCLVFVALIAGGLGYGGWQLAAALIEFVST